MQLISDIDEANNLLKQYFGASLNVFIYSSSLKRLAIRLSTPSFKEVVYVVGAGCERLNGYFHVKECDLIIIRDYSEEFRLDIIKIVDKYGNFELITSGGFAVAQGYESEFGTSFDNLIKEWPTG